MNDNNGGGQEKAPFLTKGARTLLIVFTVFMLCLCCCGGYLSPLGVWLFTNRKLAEMTENCDTSLTATIVAVEERYNEKLDIVDGYNYTYRYEFGGVCYIYTDECGDGKFYNVGDTTDIMIDSRNPGECADMALIEAEREDIGRGCKKYVIKAVIMTVLLLAAIAGGWIYNRRRSRNDPKERDDIYGKW